MYPTTFNIQVTINGTVYQAEQIPTTQEDNAGGIVDRYTLFQNGEYVGRLAQWISGQFVFVHDELDGRKRDILDLVEFLKDDGKDPYFPGLEDWEILERERAAGMRPREDDDE